MSPLGQQWSLETSVVDVLDLQLTLCYQMELVPLRERERSKTGVNTEIKISIVPVPRQTITKIETTKKNKKGESDYVAGSLSVPPPTGY